MFCFFCFFFFSFYLVNICDYPVENECFLNKVQKKKKNNVCTLLNPILTT